MIDEELQLRPIGEPYQLILSDSWAQNIGIIRGNEETVHATVYGNSNAHVRSRAEAFIYNLVTGRHINNKNSSLTPKRNKRY